MTKTLDEMLAVMQAAQTGAKIESRVPPEGAWKPCQSPSWDWDRYDYRVAPDRLKMVERMAREMYEALKLVEEHYGDDSDVFWAVRVAISKAERVLGRDER